MGAKVSAVAAIGKHRVLGKGNRLLWHIPDDLQRFKRLTEGHPVIMGRKTFESIVGYLGGPLPKRTNIVVTRDPSWTYEGVVVTASIEEAIEEAKTLDPGEVFIGGGAQIYEAALPYTDKLYLTLIHKEFKGDTFFPDYSDFKIVSEKDGESEGLRYSFLELERK